MESVWNCDFQEMNYDRNFHFLIIVYPVVAVAIVAGVVGIIAAVEPVSVHVQATMTDGYDVLLTSVLESIQNFPRGKNTSDWKNLSWNFRTPMSMSRNCAYLNCSLNQCQIVHCNRS